MLYIALGCTLYSATFIVCFYDHHELQVKCDVVQCIIIGGGSDKSMYSKAMFAVSSWNSP